MRVLLSKWPLVKIHVANHDRNQSGGVSRCAEAYDYIKGFRDSYLYNYDHDT